MPITINGSGTVTGISVGGLPDGTITGAELNGAQTGSAPIYGCRAWVNFDGTRNEADTGASTNGANVKIRASGNVTSVLKNAVGDYTVTFTTAMVDANFSGVGIATVSSTGTTNTSSTLNPSGTGTTSQTASAFRIWTKQTATLADCDFVNVAIFR